MIGKEILNYKIVSLIGKGGMGSVYLAQNKYIQQQKVAIKVINSTMINDFTRQTFAKEADRLARLNHPNIIHFINYHIDDQGNIYLIMEYADGYSLDNYIRNVSGLIVEEKICSFFEPLLDAFEYAHKNHIIHKDIKPANIIITTEGTPKILDFGISELLSEKGSDADSDVIMGTPSYMSPEQIKGQPLDQRSDIYSLGVLLHQMLTGNPPYDTTTLTEHEIYKHIINDELPRMKAYYKYVSDKVQTVVDKATAKKPEARYSSCADFKKALHNAIYPPKVARPAKIVIAAAIAVFVCAGLFIWDYSRVKVSYYKDYTEQWSIPQGIGRISNAAKKHTHRMYRFESQHYKLQRVSHVNSLGTIITDSESERYDRPLDMQFFYNDDNRLSRVKVRNHNGQVLYIKSYNEKLNTVIFQFDDEYGTEKTIASQTVGARAFDENQEKSRISRYLLEYDDNGYIRAIRYAGFQNIVVGDADGIYGKQYVRDSKGRVIEESYLAFDGSGKATKWGLGKKIFTYDEKDNWTCARYLTVDGEPCLDDPEGTSVCENSHDKYGNVVAQFFKNSDGELMIPEKYGVAGEMAEYDSHGFIRKKAFIGVDGKVEFSAKLGYASYVAECDKYGFFNKVEYLDASGAPCLAIDGISSMKMVNDPRGNELERWLYDLNGELVLNSDGYAGVKSEYDSLGNAVKVIFCGTDGEPCELSNGYAGWQCEYDWKGNITKHSYFDVQMLPVRDNDGVCTYTMERDSRGNLTKFLYFDEEGNPTLSTEGIAGIEFSYDDGGNEIERRFLDRNGKPTTGYLGYAKWTHTYDGMGHELSERYYGLDGRLTLVDGTAGTDQKVDDHGNVIERMPVGLNQKLASGKLISRYKYDSKDNIIEFALFDSDEHPATNALNYHKYMQKFNSRNQCIEICYYNTRGELTRYDDYNFCIKRTEYNGKGQAVKVSYFDKDDRPAFYSTKGDGAYSSNVSEYDNYGRVIHQLFFDRSGAPTDPKVKVPESATQYDNRGNEIYSASLDGKGNLIMNPGTGWAFTRREYDNRDNLLWAAYFNEKEQPIRCRDGYHKIVNTYTSANQPESESYFDTDGSAMTVNGYHKELYIFNESQQCTEIRYLGTNGNPVNNAYGFSRIVFTYNSDNTFKDRKYYNTAGSVLLHEQYVNGEWVSVKNWQKDVSEYSDKLPLNLGKSADNLVVRSIKIVSSTLVEIVMTTPKSKYDMPNSDIAKYKEYLQAYTRRIKQQLDIPGRVTVRGILKDSKNRIMSTIKI